MRIKYTLEGNFPINHNCGLEDIDFVLWMKSSIFLFSKHKKEETIDKNNLMGD